jgi:hypothetical protein
VRQLPNSIIGLLEELEADYPPKCKDPEESLEAHAVYAGKCELVELLRARYEAGMKSEKKGLPKVLRK